MKKVTTFLILALGLSTWMAAAQDAADRPSREGRTRPRQRPPQDRPGAEGRPPFMPPMIAALDASGDGVLDADEIADAPKALKKLDRNGDGKLALNELRPSPPGGFGGPDGPPPDGPGGPPDDRARGGQLRFDSTPLPKDEAEKKILGVLDQMNRERGGMMSVPLNDGRYLRLLAESTNPKNVVEIGTSHGYSAIWLCLALRATGGRLTTFEIDAQRAALARKNFTRAGVDSVVTLIEGDAHKEVGRLKDPIDLLFLDADKQGYLDYLNQLLPLVRPGGLIVAHNMDASQADPRYVKAITTNPALETLFINVGHSGIGVTLKKR